MKIVSVVGARPQFVKCAPVSREIRKDHTEVIVHTGQHYDPEMSDVFFSELEIPRPDYNLGVGSASHGKQTGEILAGIENVLFTEKPDLVLIYGDTNSTLAGALAAAKLQIPVAHVEAGLRSFDRTMPEEINRLLADHISSILFCPTDVSVRNLSREGVTKGVHRVGDVMADALAFNRKIAEKKSAICDKLKIRDKEYAVLTIHRAGNTDNRKILAGILSAVAASDLPVIFPVHPRTRKYLNEYGLLSNLPENIRITEPLGYIDMIRLMAGARTILTDSGGMQKEAYMLGVPCITLRENTEWVETLESGWNVLAGTDPKRIRALMMTCRSRESRRDLYPRGASARIREILNEEI